jgi:hypothetical protein
VTKHELEVYRREGAAGLARIAERLAAPRKRVARDVGPDRKAQRKATKRQSDRAVYAAVAERDEGLCTAGLAVRSELACMGLTQIDHQWGRGKAPTTVRNCRTLCERHHREKTDSRPDRLTWLRDFYNWANEHDYDAEADKAFALMALEIAQHPEARSPRGGRQEGRTG